MFVCCKGTDLFEILNFAKWKRNIKPLFFCNFSVNLNIFGSIFILVATLIRHLCLNKPFSKLSTNETLLRHKHVLIAGPDPGRPAFAQLFGKLLRV